MAQWQNSDTIQQTKEEESGATMVMRFAEEMRQIGEIISTSSIVSGGVCEDENVKLIELHGLSSNGFNFSLEREL